MSFIPQMFSFKSNRSKVCEEFKKQYRVGTVLVPKQLDSMMQLSLGKSGFLVPKSIDLRDYCVSTRDQGSRPWCAAYAAVGFAANVLWRKYDRPDQYDPELIYKFAKGVDGSPNTDGTTLDAVLGGLLHYGIFDSAKCSVRMIRTASRVKYAIHKFGCCLLGMIVTNEWYECNSGKSTISGKKNNELLGGHAVLCCGYNEDGVIIQNSWSYKWGQYGFALITWDEFSREFMYGAVLDNCLYDTQMN